jgi:hypothetical protein
MHPTLIELLVNDRRHQHLREAQHSARRVRTSRPTAPRRPRRGLMTLIRPTLPAEPWFGGINVAARYPWG